MFRKIYPLTLLAVGATTLFSPAAFAQQSTQFSQFQLTQLYFNPAVAGADGVTRFQLMHRTQYQGYQANNGDPGGAPTTQLFSASTAFKNLGVGFTAYNDKVGALSNQSFQLSAAYRFALANANLSVGASVGLYRESMNFNLLRPNETGDPIIGSGVVAESQPDVNLGVRYEAQGYYVGLSATHLVPSKYQFSTDFGSNPLKPTYYLNGGLTLEIGYLFEVQPFALVKTDFASFSAEGGAMATYNKRYWAGASYRSQDAVALMAGINMLSEQSLRLSGAYDFVIGGTSVKSPSSYEVLLSYRLPAPKLGKKTIVRTPRFRF